MFLLCQQVKAIKTNLDKDDVFILDCGLELYQWNGERSSKDEKFKAGLYLQDLRRERAGRAVVQVLESGEADLKVLTHMLHLLPSSRLLSCFYLLSSTIH